MVWVWGSDVPEKHIIFLLVPIFAVVDRGSVGLDVFFSVIGGRTIADGAILRNS